MEEENILHYELLVEERAVYLLTYLLLTDCSLPTYLGMTYLPTYLLATSLTYNRHS